MLFSTQPPKNAASPTTMLKMACVSIYLLQLKMVVVPATYEYINPPARGTPLLLNNCQPAPANEEMLTVIF
jgi:hypothetical protein